MISILLIQKILSMFIIMCCGFLLVKLKILRQEDSRILCLISVNMLFPVMIIYGFQRQYTPEIIHGLLWITAIGVVAEAILKLSGIPLKKLFKLDPVEHASTVYTNSGNLLFPIISYLFGPEWVIFAIPYNAIQTFTIWSHGSSLLLGNSQLTLKKVFTNINIIATIVGLILFVFKITITGPLFNALESVNSMVGPIAMIVVGMILGGMKFKSIFLNNRVWLVAILRLVITPIFILIPLKLSGVVSLVPNGEKICLILFCAMISPSASTITQLSQGYLGIDMAEKASAINVLTTLLCIVTMPIYVYLFQL